MITSPTTTFPRPTGDEKIPRGTLSYVLARDRQQAFDLVIRELKKSGISQATLARRLDMDRGELSRLLKRPGNWQLNTFGALLFAICGVALRFAPDHPADHVTAKQPALTTEQFEQDHKSVAAKPERKPSSVREANSTRTGNSALEISREPRSQAGRPNPPKSHITGSKTDEGAFVLA